MPNYEFHCRNEKCADNGKVRVIPMKMSEYNPNQICPTCGEVMSRVAANMVCGFIGDKDFCGKCGSK